MANFIGKLLLFKPNERMGAGEDGMEAFYKHKFFRGFDWVSLLNLSLNPPFLETISYLIF